MEELINAQVSAHKKTLLYALLIHLGTHTQAEEPRKAVGHQASNGQRCHPGGENLEKQKPCHALEAVCCHACGDRRAQSFHKRFASIRTNKDDSTNNAVGGGDRHAQDGGAHDSKGTGKFDAPSLEEIDVGHISANGAHHLVAKRVAVGRGCEYEFFPPRQTTTTYTPSATKKPAMTMIHWLLSVWLQSNMTLLYEL